MRIGEAAHQVGLSPTTLKRLEQCGLIHPQKDRNGQRRYTEDDIATIRSIYYRPAPATTTAAPDATDCTA